MSKNISIKEGDQAKNFTPNKLKTALQGGGSCLWVPKDGTRLKTISIRKPGTYQAWVEEVYGYSKATVSGLLKESEIKTISKEITENNTYRSEDEGFYGYDVVSVNVPGGGGTAPPSYVPGSSVVGTYPDGDEPVTVSVDDEGNLIKAGLADHILLDTPPDKLTYKDGERITLAGAVVRGYLKNGVPYKNASYQDSILPLYQYIDTGGDEIPGGIVFPTPLRAKYEGEGGDKESYSIDDMSTFRGDAKNHIILPVVVSHSVSFIIEGTDSLGNAYTLLNTLETNNESLFVDFYDSNENVYSINGVYSLYPDTILTFKRKKIAGTASGYDFVYTFNLNTSKQTRISKTNFYYVEMVTLYASDGVPPSDISCANEAPGIGAMQTDDHIDVATILFDGYKNTGDLTQTITLTWPREGDRKHLTTTYEIQVTP